MMKKLHFILIISIVLNFCFGYTMYYEKGLSYIKNRGFFDKTYSKDVIDEDTFVILTLGQSNAANCSNDVYQPKNEVYNYFNQNIYKAEEPLKGANGNGGISVWSRVADKLIDSGKCNKVVIIPIARGGTGINFWVNGGGYELLNKTLVDLKNQNIKLTHILWHQGEADNGNDKTVYYNNLNKLLKNIREYENAPFYCSITSYNPTSKLTETKGIDYNIQNAQYNFINDNETVFKGVNTDLIIDAIHRFDGQHFSIYGNKLYADMWFNALMGYNI